MLYLQIFNVRNYILFTISASGLFIKYSSNFANFSLDIYIIRKRHMASPRQQISIVFLRHYGTTSRRKNFKTALSLAFQMLSVRTSSEKSLHRSFWIFVWGKLGQGNQLKSQDYREVIVLEKFSFQNVFRPHENIKPAFSNFSGLKSVFEKLRFRDGFSVDGRPNRRNKAGFPNISWIIWKGKKLSDTVRNTLASSYFVLPLFALTFLTT